MPDFAFWFLSTLAATLMGYYVSGFLDTRKLPKVSKSRQRALTGTWKGELRQQANSNRDPVIIPVTLKLRVSARRIKGEMRLIDTREYVFKVSGSFHYERYLRLLYDPSGKSEAAIDVGNLFLMLDNVPNIMEGRMSGFGSISNTIIYSAMRVQKEGEDAPEMPTKTPPNLTVVNGSAPASEAS